MYGSRAVDVNPGAEACRMAVAATANNTWEWCGMVVPVIRDTLDVDVLAISVHMLLRMNLDGIDVGLIVFEPDQVGGLLV